MSAGSTPSIQGSPMVASSLSQPEYGLSMSPQDWSPQRCPESVQPLKGGVLWSVLTYWVNVSQWDSMTLVLPLILASPPRGLHHAGVLIGCTNSVTNWKPQTSEPNLFSL